MPLLFTLWAVLISLSMTNGAKPSPDRPFPPKYKIFPIAQNANALTCDCSITQSGNTYPISALQGTVSASAFYSYGVPNGSSANTGLELNNGLILFLYEDTNTGVISLFLIADIANSGTGGSLQFDLNCLPTTAFISVEDDQGEFSGAPPLFSGNWSWSSCCTDGGVIEDIGCNNTINLDLLISSGIDSIVWLTGDIMMPDQILLDLSGEAITISCGTGGICCPLTLDTQVSVTDATCSDTPNGSITLAPQDGIPAYSYNWANGETTAHIDNLLPGSYPVTVTDSQGCTEELVVDVNVSPGTPAANPASIELCSETSTGVFDLTTVENTINGGTGFNVLWFQNPDMTGSIGNPSSYTSGNATIYAVVDNGSCLSVPVPVEITILQSPIPNPASMHSCEVSNDMALFDLTTLEATVSGGSGNVLWYEDFNLSNPISNPSAFLSESTIIYAVVDDGTCVSDPVQVELIVDPKPEGFPAEMNLCGDDAFEAIFDLTLLDLQVSDGLGTVQWYTDVQLNDPILIPSAFQTTTTIVYATVFDGICYSDPVQVHLTVDPTAVANPITITLCDDGSSMALIDLTDYEFQVGGNGGAIDWYLDLFLTEPIPDPTNFLTEATTIYATVDNGLCVSDPVAITILLQMNVEGNPTSLSTCADSSGQGIFNLTLIDIVVSGGTGMVQWYEDAQGNFPIAVDTAYTTTGVTVYAQVVNGVCFSPLVPVDLIIISTVSATPTTYAACDDGSGISTFDLTTVESIVSNNTGVVSWYFDSLGTMPISPVDSFPSSDTTLYARVTAGTCVSNIVPVDLMVLSTPQSFGLTINLCGDTSAIALIDLTTLDTMVSGNNGTVSWYADSMMPTPIMTPTVFMTGDTTIYAIVSNGACLSAPAAVVLHVSDALVANPITLNFCVPAGDTLLIDLTQSNVDVAGGPSQVNWYLDSLGVNVIAAPDSFPGTSTTIVYAASTDGLCESELVPVDLEILDLPVANPFTISKCGNAGAQVVFDLVSIDSFISENTGNVNWFIDQGLTDSILTPGAFLSGDSIVYATVTNGFCGSPVVAVTLDVTDSLTANAIVIESCQLNTSTATINLTLSNGAISGGSGTVTWFTDSLGLDTIFNPNAFVTTGDTVYAIVTADGCQSNIAMIPIEVATAAFPAPACGFSSIDSLSVSWLPVNDQFAVTYALNGNVIGNNQMTQSTQFNLGGLGQGDTLTLWVTALFDSICTMPLTDSIICITDVCPLQTISFSNLATAYCRDDVAVPLIVSPPGGQLSGQGVVGNMFDPGLVVGNSAAIQYSYQDVTTGCVYDTSFTIAIADPLLPPVVSCIAPTLNTVTFDWPPIAPNYGYEYILNNNPLTGPLQTANTTLIFANLLEGDSVTLTIWTIGTAPCGNSDSVTVKCYTKLCPQATLQITDPGSLCSEDDPIQMDVIINGLPGSPVITWSGSGISNSSGTFDPKLASIGANTLTVTVEDDGCVYDSSIDVFVQPQPQSLFDLDGVPCLDSSLQVTFTGQASGNAQFMWNFSGGDTTQINSPQKFFIHWPQPGDYMLSLVIQDNGCISDPYMLPVSVDAPLNSLVLNCLEEDYHSLTITWQPVIGATQYQAVSSAGVGTINGTTYTVGQLKDNLVVTMTITAIGASACGPVSATIECQTLEFIPPRLYIPNVFSPNQDGINDVFFLQANPEVTDITALRIFDRWGNIVFERFNFKPDDPSQGWDGSFEGKVMNPDVFTYSVEYKTKYDTVETKAGDVTLVR